MPRRKPFSEMRGYDADPEMIQALVENNGNRLPDNFGESANGTIVGQPNINTDPQGQQLVRDLDQVIGEGYPDVKRQLDQY